jgi:hypothetical protein
VVTDIPASLSTINTAVVTDIPADIADVQTTVDTIETAVVTDIPADIADVQTTVNTIETAVATTLPNTLSTINTAVVTDIPGDIANVQNAVNIMAAGTNLADVQDAIQGTDDTNTLTTIAASIGTPTRSLTSTLFADIENLGNVETDISSISAQFTATQGATFDPATDSLVAISTNIGAPAGFMTVASGLYSIIGAPVYQTIAENIGAPSYIGMTEVEPSSGLYAELDSIQGTSFSSSTDSLHAISNAIAALPFSDAIADIEGDGFVSADNSLVAITAAISSNRGVITDDLSDIKGSGFDSAADSLVAIQNNIDSWMSGIGTMIINLGTNSDDSGIVYQFEDTRTAITNATNATATNISNSTSATATNITTSQGVVTSAITSGTNATATNISNSTSATATNITNATSPLATSAQVGSLVNTNGTATIGGILGNPGMSTGAASISAAIGTPAAASVSADIALLGVIGNGTTTATGLYAQDYAIKGTNDNTATAVSGGTSYTASTNNLSSLAKSLSQIEGSGFTSANSLVNLATASSIGTPVNTGGTQTIAGILGDAANNSIVNRLTTMQQTLALLVNQLIGDPIIASLNPSRNNPALTTTVTSTDTANNAAALLASYNAALATALTDAATAATAGTQTYAHTNTAIGSLATANSAFSNLANAWLANHPTGGGPTSAYSAAQIQNALAGLNSALAYLLAQQVEAA